MINQFDSDETIVALATAREPGYSRGIVRLSGSDTMRILGHSFKPKGPIGLEDCRWPTRLQGEMECLRLSTPIPVEVLFWPTIRSYTGQVSAEIHAPGSIPILDAIVQQICENGARLAQPGEFTMRAFLGGRIDLTEAEAVLGVIDANDQNHLNIALKQLSGGLSQPIRRSRDDLLHALAQLEAGLDFVEEDIEFVTQEELLAQISKCQSDLLQLKDQLSSRDQMETTLRLVLYGQPNAGKSSLFNELVRKYGRTSQAAIVSPESGTTRDFISSTLNIKGKEMILIDTAGVESRAFRPSENQPPESSPLQLGQEQSLIQQLESKLTLLCLDSSQSRSSWENELLIDDQARTIVCLTKSDLPSKAMLPEDAEKFEATAGSVIRVSSMTGEGIDALAKYIVELSDENEPAESVPCTAVRCELVVNEALESLALAQELVLHSAGEELVACELRSALDAIGKITGAVYTDDILDVIFSQFCIGK